MINLNSLLGDLRVVFVVVLRLEAPSCLVDDFELNKEGPKFDCSFLELEKD